ncbi:hypothetical protein BIV59_07350 [Bacillus sp. MUM 13]|nr:hypothetical protein BIV59_07350 [Bacillus sp. MUM 13]
MGVTKTLPQDAVFLIFDPLTKALALFISPAPAPSSLCKRYFDLRRQRTPSKAKILFASRTDQGACAFY